MKKSILLLALLLSAQIVSAQKATSAEAFIKKWKSNSAVTYQRVDNLKDAIATQIQAEKGDTTGWEEQWRQKTDSTIAAKSGNRIDIISINNFAMSSILGDDRKVSMDVLMCPDKNDSKSKRFVKALTNLKLTDEWKLMAELNQDGKEVSIYFRKHGKAFDLLAYSSEQPAFSLISGLECDLSDLKINVEP